MKELLFGRVRLALAVVFVSFGVLSLVISGWGRLRDTLHSDPVVLPPVRWAFWRVSFELCVGV